MLVMTLVQARGLLYSCNVGRRKKTVSSTAYTASPRGQTLFYDDRTSSIVMLSVPIIAAYSTYERRAELKCRGARRQLGKPSPAPNKAVNQLAALRAGSEHVNTHESEDN
jgi:hypothetical protein